MFALKNKQIIVTILFAVLSSIPVLGQQFETALARYAAEYPAEKIYIHYDKEYYVAGETIWFKAYLYNDGLPGIVSNNFYVQLLDEAGKLYIQNKYPVSGATVKGNIELPDSLPQGDYYVRAFTPGMLNSNQDFLYTKSLLVLNPSFKKSRELQKPVSGSVSIQFFPESGDMLEDVLSVVAFKAVDSLGKPLDIAGTIKTDDGTNIAVFKSFHDGIGKVQFKPQAGKKYVAVIDINGQPGYFPLPRVQSTGVNLKVENEKGGKMFQITRSKKDKDSFQKIWLVAEMNKKIIYANEIYFDSYMSVKGHLLTDSMPSGILHFTVFNNDNTPLAERLSFVNNGEFRTTTDIEILKKANGPRQENSFDVVFQDNIQRSLSVSVTDVTIPPYTRNENIITSLLLTSDLKGYINNPLYYFQQGNDSVQQAMDNLMLTHGWSRYKWEKILAGELPTQKFMDNYLISITGYLKDSKTKSAVDKGKLAVYFESEDSVNHNFDVKVDVDGKFVIDSLLIFGKTKFFYAYSTAQGKEMPVDISLEPLSVDNATEVLAFNIPEKEMKSTDRDLYTNIEVINRRYRPANSKLEKTKDLAPVVVESKSNKRPIDIVNEEYTRGVFTSMGKVNIDNINEPNNDKSISVYDYIRTFIRQVEVQDNNFVNKKNFSLTAQMTPKQLKLKQEKIDALLNGFYQPTKEELAAVSNENAPGKKFIVTTFLNESPVDISFLKTIRMDEVALLKFYEPGFIGAGSGGPGGALSIYTKQPVKYTGPGVEKLDYILYKGYTITKEFYSPDYSRLEQKSEFEDNRTTLYWNPNLYTDNNTKSVKFNFYNNDFSRKFRIIVEGFDALGRLIYVEKMIGN